MICSEQGRRRKKINAHLTEGNSQGHCAMKCSCTTEMLGKEVKQKPRSAKERRFGSLPGPPKKRWCTKGCRVLAIAVAHEQGAARCVVFEDRLTGSDKRLASAKGRAKWRGS